MNASQGEEGKSCDSISVRRRRALLNSLLAVVITGLLLAVACAQEHTPALQATGAPTISATPRTPAPGDRSSAAPTAPVTTTNTLTLTIWGPDFMGPTADAPGGAVLAAQIDAFCKAHPGWQIRYVRKRPYGVGGVTQYLSAARAVAPDSLPDLALVDMREIGLLAAVSLPQPLEPILGADVVADLMPFAREAGQVGDHLLAAQYEADIGFLAYNSGVISTPPTTWSQVLAGQAGYLLPIGASEGAVYDAFLPQYLALGGKVWDANGRPYLDETIVAEILEAYRAALQAGILSSAGLNLKDASDCWPVYLTGQAPSGSLAVAMTNVSSWDYDRDRGRLARTRVSPLPTLSGTPISMSDGWGWVLISRDNQRRAIAADFLRAVLQPDAMAAWSQATFHLPTRRSALPLAIKDSDYLHFLQQTMETATPEPREPAYSQIVAALSPAIENVARGLVSPQTAAAEAAERVRTSSEQPSPTTQH